MRVFGVHLSAVHAAWTERRRVVRAARAAARASRGTSTGSTCWSATSTRSRPASCSTSRQLPHRLRALVWLSGGRIRWRTIQIMLDAGYVDGYRVLHPDDAGYTFPTWDPHVRLDYVFVPSRVRRRISGRARSSRPRVARGIGSSAAAGGN